MPDTVLDGARRARIEAAVVRGADEDVWSCWTDDGADATAAFVTAYAMLMAWARTDPPGALRVVEGLRDRVLRSLDAGARARLVRLHGHVLRANGRFRDAAVQYADAVRRFEDEGDAVEVLRTAIGRVDVLSMADEFDTALELARSVRRRLGRRDPVLTARLDVNVGAIHHRTGHPQRAVDAYRRARRVLQRARLATDVALVDFNLGQSLLELGQLAEADRCFRRSREGFDKRGFAAQVLRARFGGAAVAIQRGHWDEARHEIEELHEALEQIGDEQAVAALRWELGRIWGAFGDRERAVAEAESAFATYERLGVGRDAAHVARWIARWLQDLGRLSDARLRLERARAHFQAIGDAVSTRRIDVEQAAIAVATGRLRDARTRLQRLQAPLDRSDPETALRCRVLLAEIDLRQGRPASARRRALRAHEDAGSTMGRLDRPAIALVLARAEAARGDAREATRWAKRAARDLEALAGATADEALRRALRVGRLDVVRQAVEVVLENGGARADHDALDLIVRARSRELVEALLAEVPSMSRGARARIAFLRQQLLDAAESYRNDVRTRALGRGIERIDGELLRSAQRRFEVVRRTAREARIEGWASRLGDDAVVLFERVGRAWHAFVVQRARVRRVDLELDDHALGTAWKPLQLLLEAASGMPTERRRRFLERTRDEATSRLHELGRRLWSSLDALPDRVHVVLPPELHEVPVEAAAEVYFERDDLVVSRWPHPALIRTDRPRRRGTAVLLHDGTPGRRDEADVIRRELEGGGTPVIEGTTRGRLDDAASIGLFHVAAHGAVSRGHWIGTGILLEDGWFGLEQIAGDRRYRDATLFFASCASGHQSLRPQGSFDGWVSASLGSGAREIVMALWKIDDHESQRFTHDFYRLWSDGIDAATASSRVRRDARARGDHPYGWASFSVVG